MRFAIIWQSCKFIADIMRFLYIIITIMQENKYNAN